jgi:hypothetical protein
VLRLTGNSGTSLQEHYGVPGALRNWVSAFGSRFPRLFRPKSHRIQPRPHARNVHFKKNQLSYSCVRNYPRRMMTPHCISALLRVATRANGVCAASAKTTAVVRRAAVGDPPLPFYFLKTPPFFSNTRQGAAYTKRRDQSAYQRRNISAAVPPALAARCSTRMGNQEGVPSSCPVPRELPFTRVIPAFARMTIFRSDFRGCACHHCHFGGCI